MQRESDRRRSWKSKERGRWEFKSRKIARELWESKSSKIVWVKKIYVAMSQDCSRIVRIAISQDCLSKKNLPCNLARLLEEYENCENCNFARLLESKNLLFPPGARPCNPERDSRQDGAWEKGEGRKRVLLSPLFTFHQTECWLPNVWFSLVLRAWVRKTDADLEAAAKAAQLEEDREIPILPYSSLFILSSNNK